MESNRQQELESMSWYELNKIMTCVVENDRFDYDNPEDIMPLAIENGISLEYLPCTEEWCAQEAKELTNRAFNINPYRAICIVLILMKESENA